MFASATSGAIFAEAEVRNLSPPSKIGTGICFLDHMIDQFTSHGQLGVTLRCAANANGDGSAVLSAGKRSAPDKPTNFFAPHRDYAIGSTTARPHDRDIFIACGTALGIALRHMVDEVLSARQAQQTEANMSGMATFCCPLDEAFAEAVVNLSPTADSRGHCNLSLEPYGAFASGGAGRKWIGRYRTELTPLFWQGLVTGLGADVSLRKVRGANAHHILESAFKSFARAFRAALDQLTDGQVTAAHLPDQTCPPTLAGRTLARLDSCATTRPIHRPLHSRAEPRLRTTHCWTNAACGPARPAAPCRPPC